MAGSLLQASLRGFVELLQVAAHGQRFDRTDGEFDVATGVAASGASHVGSAPTHHLIAEAVGLGDKRLVRLKDLRFGVGHGVKGRGQRGADEAVRHS
jgi:hypothetical protein